MQVFESLARICVVAVRNYDENERNQQFGLLFNNTIKSKILDVISTKLNNIE